MSPPGWLRCGLVQPSRVRTARRRLTLAAALAATLAGAGCGRSGVSAEAPSAPSPPAPASAKPRTDTVRPSAMRFSMRSYSCRPQYSPQVGGQWETSAPRDVVSVGSTVLLGLRDRNGAGTLPVEAWVYAPRGGVAHARATAVGTHWAAVHFPRDFLGASGRPVRGYGPGVFTVVWRTAGPPPRFITCDGFAVR